mgnify:CR=1 FL=1
MLFDLKNRQKDDIDEGVLLCAFAVELGQVVRATPLTVYNEVSRSTPVTVYNEVSTSTPLTVYNGASTSTPFTVNNGESTVRR